MASIGNVACSIVRGNRTPQQERIETFEIPGIDGVGIHKYGKGGGQWQAEAAYYSSGANVEAWYVSLCELQGQIVIVINDWAVTIPDVLVLQVGPLQKMVAEGEGGARGSAQLLLQTME
jgi:hypothetical protein